MRLRLMSGMCGIEEQCPASLDDEAANGRPVGALMVIVGCGPGPVALAVRIVRPFGPEASRNGEPRHNL